MIQRIAIHSVPRSGSTWLGSIFDSHPNVIYKYQPLFSYRFKDFLDAGSSKKTIEDFFVMIAETPDDFTDQVEAKRKGLVPDFKKYGTQAVVYKEVRYHHILKNLLEKDREIKIIGLIRNPLAVITSWLRAPKEFREKDGWKAEEEWQYAFKKNQDKPEEYNGYEKWKEVTFLFEDLKSKYPDRFYLLNYNDLLNNVVECIKNLFIFCGLEMLKETIDFIRQSSSINQKDAYSVYKVKEKDDAWVNDLPDSITRQIINDHDFIELNKRYGWINNKSA